MTSNIAITGISCITGLGNGLNTWIAALQEKKSVPSRIDPAMFQGEIERIDKGPYEMHRVQKILAITFLRALEDAGITITKSNADRCAIFVGNTYGVEEFKAGFQKTIKANLPYPISPSLFPYTTANSISANLSALLGIKGMNITFSNGTTSASEAIVAANDILCAGKADIVIVGGEGFICDDFCEEFYRCGFKQECCAALVLEKKESIDISKRKIYALIEELSHGFDSEKNVVSNSIDVKGKLILRKMCPQNMKDIDYVLVNQGNSFGEKSLISEETSNFEDQKDKYLSLESMFGNTFSAAGVLGVLFSCLISNKNGILSLNRNGKSLKRGLFINKDNYGGFTSMVISGEKNGKSI